MIVNHDKKWIYISPPKTASTALCFLLTDGAYQNNLWGKTLQPNFGGINEATQHFPLNMDYLDDKYNTYMRFVSVRNPFTRIISLFNHWKYGHNAIASNIDKTDIDLFGFLKLVLQSRTDDSIQLGGNSFFNKSCCNWWKPGYNVIRVENLKNDLDRLNLHQNDYEIPLLNDMKYLPKDIKNKELHTSETIELTIEWANEDFELFGYEKKLENLDFFA